MKFYVCSRMDNKIVITLNVVGESYMEYEVNRYGAFAYFSRMHRPISLAQLRAIISKINRKSEYSYITCEKISGPAVTVTYSHIFGGIPNRLTIPEKLNALIDGAIEMGWFGREERDIARGLYIKG